MNKQQIDLRIRLGHGHDPYVGLMMRAFHKIIKGSYEGLLEVFQGSGESIEAKVDILVTDSLALAIKERRPERIVILLGHTSEKKPKGIISIATTSQIKGAIKEALGKRTHSYFLP